MEAFFFKDGEGEWFEKIGSSMDLKKINQARMNETLLCQLKNFLWPKQNIQNERNSTNYSAVK